MVAAGVIPAEGLTTSGPLLQPHIIISETPANVTSEKSTTTDRVSEEDEAAVWTALRPTMVMLMVVWAGLSFGGILLTAWWGRTVDRVVAHSLEPHKWTCQWNHSIRQQRAQGVDRL